MVIRGGGGYSTVDHEHDEAASIRYAAGMADGSTIFELPAVFRAAVASDWLATVSAQHRQACAWIIRWKIGGFGHSPNKAAQPTAGIRYVVRRFHFSVFTVAVVSVSSFSFLSSFSIWVRMAVVFSRVCFLM